MQPTYFVPDDWYKTFFSPPINAFWEALVPDSVTHAECDFLERHLRRTSPSRLLDIPCGAGRHSLALARRGHTVTGIDLSSDAIERAQRKAVTENLAAQFLHQDMANFSVAENFDGAICMGNSFGYLQHEQTLQFLRLLAGALRTGARFIVDTGLTAESILPTFEKAAQYDVDGFSFEICNRYDIAQSRLLTHTVLRKETDEWTQSFSQAVYTSGELTRMFASAGFTIVARVADLDDKPYALGEQRLMLIAQRN